MRKFICALVVLSLISCSEPENIPNPDFTEREFLAVKSRSTLQSKAVESKEFFKKMASFYSENYSDVIVKCGSKGYETVELILEIASDGRIVRVYASPWGGKSACFVATLEGKAAPRPPGGPFFLSSVMK